MQPNAGLDQSVNDPNAGQESFDFGDSMNQSKDIGRQSVGSVAGGAGAASNAGQGTTMLNTGAGLAVGP